MLCLVLGTLDVVEDDFVVVEVAVVAGVFIVDVVFVVEIVLVAFVVEIVLVVVIDVVCCICSLLLIVSIQNAIHSMTKSESNQVFGYFDKMEVILLLSSSSNDKNHQFITSTYC